LAATACSRKALPDILGKNRKPEQINDMLKKFTVISLFILLLPIFQTCSDKNITENTFLKNGPLSEPVTSIYEVEKNYNLSLDQLILRKKKAIDEFLKLKKKLTQNGYEIGFLFIQDIRSFQWILFPFTVSILINFILIILSFARKIKAVFILSIVNIGLIVLPLIPLYFGNVFEDIEQLKIGFYLLIINLALIAFQSYYQLKTSGNSL